MSLSKEMWNTKFAGVCIYWHSAGTDLITGEVGVWWNAENSGGGKKKGNCTLKSTDIRALCMLSSLNIITFDTKFQEVCATESQLRLWVLVINYCIISYHKLSALKQYISPTCSVSVGAWTRLIGSTVGKVIIKGLSKCRRSPEAQLRMGFAKLSHIFAELISLGLQN